MDAEKLVKEIRTDVLEGYRFVALVGAGLSAPSGFPLVSDLQARYLRYWILRALRLNPMATEEDELEAPSYSRWEPRFGDWPSMPVEVAESWTPPTDAQVKPIHPRPLSQQSLDGVLYLALKKKKADCAALPWLSVEIIA